MRSKLSAWAKSAPAILIMLTWAAHLAYPMHRLQYVRWTFFGSQVPVYYFFTVAVIAGSTLAAFAAKREWNKWDVLWWALPLVCWPGILLSSDRFWSIRQWLSWIVRGLAPGGITLLASEQRAIRALFLRVVYPIAIGAALLGLFEVFVQRNPIWERFNYVIPQTAQPLNPFYRPRYEMAPSDSPQGTQGNRIPYASTLVGFLPIGIWLFKHGNRRRWLHAGGVAILYSAVLLSRSRSSWVAVLAAIPFLYGAGLVRGKSLIKLLLGFSVCLAAFLAIPQTRDRLWSRFHSFHGTEKSIRHRADLLATAVILKDRGLFGVGFGQFAEATSPYYHGLRWQPYFNGETWIGTPDNQYVRWAIENGLPGLAALMLFLGGAAIAGWKRVRRLADRREADYYAAVLIGWGSVAVTFFFFDGFYWGACNMTFWCFFGLFATILSSEPPPELDDARVARPVVE